MIKSDISESEMTLTALRAEVTELHSTVSELVRAGTIMGRALMLLMGEDFKSPEPAPSLTVIKGSRRGKPTRRRGTMHSVRETP